MLSRLDPRLAVVLRSERRRRGFTLTELLVVIALVVLLVGILLTALNQVQKKARQTTTLTTMRSFANACESFEQEHGFYPGVVPEATLIHSHDNGGARITGAENAILHLMGGYIREIDVEPGAYAAYTGIEFVFPEPSGGDFKIKVDPTRIGEGPTINGKPYPSYFNPSERELSRVDGQLGDNPDMPTEHLPDLVDAWGQPIIVLRRVRPLGPLTIASGGTPAQFDPITTAPYTESDLLGNLEQDQLNNSILSTGVQGTPSGSPALVRANLARIIEHPALPGQARGAIVMISAGPDGIYLSKEDGAGSPGEPNWVTEINTPEFSPEIVNEYDDVVVFSGS